MRFNRRNMEVQRRAAADKATVFCGALDPQAQEDTRRLLRRKFTAPARTAQGQTRHFVREFGLPLLCPSEGSRLRRWLPGSRGLSRQSRGQTMGLLDDGANIVTVHLPRLYYDWRDKRRLKKDIERSQMV